MQFEFCNEEKILKTHDLLQTAMKNHPSLQKNADNFGAQFSWRLVETLVIVLIFAVALVTALICKL